MELSRAHLLVKDHRDQAISHLATAMKLALGIAVGCMDFVHVLRAGSAGEYPPPFPGETYGFLTTPAERLKRGEELLELGKQIIARGDELLSKLNSPPESSMPRLVAPKFGEHRQT